MPVLDAAIRETLRVTLNGTALRRSIREDITIGGKVIERGAFMAYSLADVHLNDTLYPNPSNFDPGRFMEVGNNSDVPFLGWGIGAFTETGSFVPRSPITIIRQTPLYWHESRKIGIEDDHDSFCFGIRL